MLGDDLQQVLPGQVITAFQINNLDVATLADKSRNVVERHIVTGFGVVQTTACISFDQEWFGFLGQNISSRFGIAEKP
jgi:hypothetical protein